jgi:hypothetical protein
MVRLVSRRTTIAGLAALASERALPAPKQLCGAVADAPSGGGGGGGLVCTPTFNAVPLVQFNGNVSGLALPNVSPFGPNPISFLLHSSWHCCPPGPGPVTGCDMGFSPINIFSVNVGASAGSGATCEIKVYTTPLGTVQFDGHYNPLPNQQWHVLVSVNTDTQTVQLYVNDVLYSPTSGGWTGSGQMPGMAGVGEITTLDVGSSGGMYAAVANLWEMATPSWVDLSVVANRRKFINADLSPVDLGSTGGNPFGSPPNFYLEASSGVPTDFAINKGTAGGTFTINLDGPLTMQAPGTCPCAARVSCSPTVNPVPLVALNAAGGVLISTHQFFPAGNFPYFLHSSWHCCPADASGVTGTTIAPIEFFSLHVVGSLTSPVGEVKVGGGTPFYDGNFALPVGEIWHVIVSVNCNTQVVQICVNDTLVSLTSGGWITSGLMNESTSPIWDVASGVSAGGSISGMSDVWEAIPASFFDLSVVANRRKFINADLSPADLGANGENPLGTSPPIYLRAKTGPNDLLTNYGTGGSVGLYSGITLVMQAPGACSCP